MTVGYVEDYEGEYAGQGFDTGEELVGWLASMVTTFPNEYWPVWIDYDGVALRVGVLLPATGRSLIAFAAHAYEQDFLVAKEITLQTAVSRTRRGFPRSIPADETAAVFDGLGDEEEETDPLAEAIEPFDPHVGIGA